MTKKQLKEKLKIDWIKNRKYNQDELYKAMHRKLSLDCISIMWLLILGWIIAIITLYILFIV